MSNIAARLSAIERAGIHNPHHARPRTSPPFDHDGFAAVCNEYFTRNPEQVESWIEQYNAERLLNK